MTHADRDSSEPKCHGVSPTGRAKWQNGDCPHEIPLLNRATKPQDATGATPAPLDTHWESCDVHDGKPCDCASWPPARVHHAADLTDALQQASAISRQVADGCSQHQAYYAPDAGVCDGAEDDPQGRICIRVTQGVPAGLPLHEPTDRDAGTIPSDEERRTVCAKCGQFLGGFHKHCDGEWVEEVRTVTPWRRVPHEHDWVRYQNVTSRGYRLPAYEVCACGNARSTEDALRRPEPTEAQ